jgi:hypothetical protein
MRPVAFALCALAAAAPAPQLAAQDGGFVIRLGRDTTAVERFTWSGHRLEGETASRLPRTIRRRFAYEFGAEGRPVRIQISQYRPGAPGDTAAIERATATVRGDTLVAEVRRDTVQTQRVAVPASPFVPLFQGAAGSFLAYELVADYLHRRRSEDSVGVPVVAGQNQRTWRAGRMGRDSIWIYDGNNRFLARVDRRGRIQSATAVSGTQQFTIERVRGVDVAAVAAAWGARDQQGGAMGQLSTRDTVRASVAGASIWIDYGRPARRGRTLFGSTIVPWGQVWRTGANAATQFRTDRDLEIQGVIIPAGTYTLWTIPYETGGVWKLLFNRQTGQWGTSHDPARDMAQLDLRVSALPGVVERFTIAVRPEGSGGALTMEWDTVRAALTFTVR